MNDRFRYNNPAEQNETESQLGLVSVIRTSGILQIESNHDLALGWTCNHQSER